MKKLPMTILIFILLALCSNPAIAEDVAPALINAYAFSIWPVSEDEPVQLPSLDSLVVAGMALISKQTSGGTVVYQWGEQPQHIRLKVTIRSYESNDDARNGLLGILGGYSMILPKSSDYKLNAGDVGFVVVDGENISKSVFVKKNVTVVVEDVDPEQPALVEYTSVQIDILI
jgi:hypothetical protein